MDVRQTTPKLIPLFSANIGVNIPTVFPLISPRWWWKYRSHPRDQVQQRPKRDSDWRHRRAPEESCKNPKETGESNCAALQACPQWEVVRRITAAVGFAVV